MEITKDILYKKACFELNEVINNLTIEEKNKIPELFKENIQKKMIPTDFVYNSSKGILKQNFMLETKALLIEMYNKYLANDKEKEILNKYRKVCTIELEKKKYNIYKNSDIFKNTKKIPEKENNSENVSIIKYEKESFIKKIIHKIINKIKI